MFCYFIMAALCNYIFALWFLLSLFLSIFFSSPNLSRRRLDARLKPAARGSLEMKDPKKSPKVAIWAPSHKFVGLYLRN